MRPQRGHDPHVQSRWSRGMGSTRAWGLKPDPTGPTQGQLLNLTFSLSHSGIEKSLAQTPTGFLCWELTSVADSPLPHS